jgi:hypothetical protein
MKDEVEDFLRRVAQMRASAEAQAKGQQPRPAPQRPPPKQPRTVPVARLVPAQQSPAPPLPVEIVDAELAERGDRLGERVRSDLRGTEQIAEHTRQLGADVDAADTKMQAHLHQVFDHKLGQLKSSGGETALVTGDRSAAEQSLDQIRRMLRSPQSVRDAIIMSEVLRRPDF